MNNIIETAVNTPDLSTLVAAVTAADLVTTLQGAGPFTVFAPVNSAFAKLPKGTVETLVKPENKDQLTQILTYHVVSGTYLSSDLEDGAVITTLQGEDLTVSLLNGKVMLLDVKGQTVEVIAANLEQSNGVVHLIDTVLMPS
jgi:uncharacterized surface protein with fasciclin (FAS1) repeats